MADEADVKKAAEQSAADQQAAEAKASQDAAKAADKADTTASKSADKAADVAENAQPDVTPDLEAAAAANAGTDTDDKLAALSTHPDRDVEDQVEELEKTKEELYADTVSRVSTVKDDQETVGIIDANSGVPAYRKPSKTVTKDETTKRAAKESEGDRVAAADDITIAEKQTPSDLVLGEDRPVYDPSLQKAREAEFHQKELSKPLGDPRDSVFEAVPRDTSDDGLDAGGRWNPDASEDEHPDYVVNEQHYLTVTDEGSFTEIASRLGFGQPSVAGRQIANLNGIHDGRDTVTQGQKILLPQGYDYQ